MSPVDFFAIWKNLLIKMEKEKAEFCEDNKINKFKQDCVTE